MINTNPKIKYENLEYGFFNTVGQFDIPIIKPVTVRECPPLIGFNYAKTEKHPEEKGVHFFVDDYQFNRVWNRPNDYVKLLAKFKMVLAPDFSLYTDFPVAMQMYNHYRKHWLAAYWQSLGITVVPTVCWSDEQSFVWCFDGEPVGGTVAVSAIGTQNSKETKEAFLKGYNEMLKRLEPEKIIFYGPIPEECKGDFIRVKAFQEKWKEVKVNGR